MIHHYLNGKTALQLKDACLQLLDGTTASDSNKYKLDYLNVLKEWIDMTGSSPAIFAQAKSIHAFSEKFTGDKTKALLIAKTYAERENIEQALNLIPHDTNNLHSMVLYLCNQLTFEIVQKKLSSHYEDLFLFASHFLIPLGKYNEAASVLENAVAFDTKNDQVRLKWIESLANDRQIQPISELIQPIEFHPHHMTMLLNISAALIQFNEIETAKKVLEKIDISQLEYYDSSKYRYALYQLFCNGKTDFDTTINLYSTFGKTIVTRILYGNLFHDIGSSIFQNIDAQQLNGYEEIYNYLFTAYQTGIDLDPTIWKSLFKQIQPDQNRSSFNLYTRYLQKDDRDDDAVSAISDWYNRNPSSKDAFANLGSALLPQHLGWYSPELLWKRNQLSEQFEMDNKELEQDKLIAEKALSFFEKDLHQKKLGDFRRLQMTRTLLSLNRPDEAKELFFKKEFYRISFSGRIEILECARQFLWANQPHAARLALSYVGRLQRLVPEASPIGFILEYYFNMIDGIEVDLNHFKKVLRRFPPDGSSLPFAMLTSFQAQLYDTCISLYESFDPIRSNQHRGILAANIVQYRGEELLNRTVGPTCTHIAALAYEALGQTQQAQKLQSSLPHPDDKSFMAYNLLSFPH